MYDYLIVGAGLYGAVAADLLTQCGKRCLVIEKRGHIGGNVYTEAVHGINVHKYGAHIFHTDDQEVWAYMNRFATFNHLMPIMSIALGHSTIERYVLRQSFLIWIITRAMPL